MTGLLGVLIVLVLVLAAHSWAERRGSSAPVVLLALLLGIAAIEFMRFDQGLGDAVFAVAFVAAPIVAIFCGALWGSRRFYGWPDLGPMPGRAAAVSLAILLGVLIGTKIREIWDVPATRERAERVREKLLEWRTSNAGRWPASFAEAEVGAPRTRLGTLRPPWFEYEPSPRGPKILVPMSAGRRMVLDVLDDAWSTRESP